MNNYCFSEESKFTKEIDTEDININYLKTTLRGKSNQVTQEKFFKFENKNFLFVIIFNFRIKLLTKFNFKK